MSDDNPYDILGVSPDISHEDLKRHYKSLAQKYHPDKGGDGEVFAKMSWAYEILGDEKKRAQYDATGMSDANNQERMAFQRIAVEFHQLAEECAWGDGVPYTKLLVERFTEANIENSAIILQLTQRVEQLKSVTLPVSKHGETETVFQAVLDREIQGAEHELGQCRDAIEINEIVLQILEGFWDVEERVELPMWAR